MSDESLVVKCPLGSVQGSVYKTVNEENIFAFQGVPYGQPPTGHLRFKDPVPIEPWTGVKAAVNPPPKALCLAMSATDEICLSPDHNEDCLYLNIFTPKIPNPKLNLPVMVYFHGGGFTIGTGNADNCGPDFLVPHGVILVTVNYRLGAFGFLSLQTPECPGNFGLKDQSLALSWIKSNISAFGGNPSNVTIFGESAGSASVHYHMISKLSRGLFKRAIAQSGTATNRWAFSRFPQKSATVLAEQISGKTLSSADEVLAILKSASPLDILIQSETVYERVEGLWAGEHICKFAFAPTVEPVNAENPFLIKHPQQALDDGDSVDVPIITGVCAQEGLFLLPGADYVPDANNLTDFEKLLPKETGVKLGSEPAAAAAQKLKKFYFPNGVNQEDYIKAASDMVITYNVAKHAQQYAEKKESPLYFYVFSGGREPSTIKKMLNLTNVKGTSHADDLEYLFTGNGGLRAPADHPILKGSKDDNIKNLLTKIWTDFAKEGKVPAEWKPVKHPENDYVEITDKIEPKKDFHSDMIQFWDEIYAFLSDSQLQR